MCEAEDALGKKVGTALEVQAENQAAWVKCVNETLEAQRYYLKAVHETLDRAGLLRTCGQGASVTTSPSNDIEDLKYKVALESASSLNADVAELHTSLRDVKKSVSFFEEELKSLKLAYSTSDTVQELASTMDRQLTSTRVDGLQAFMDETRRKMDNFAQELQSVRDEYTPASTSLTKDKLRHGSKMQDVVDGVFAEVGMLQEETSSQRFVSNVREQLDHMRKAESSELKIGQRLRVLPSKGFISEGMEYYQEGDLGLVTQFFTADDGQVWFSVAWDRTGLMSSHRRAMWTDRFAIERLSDNSEAAPEPEQKHQQNSALCGEPTLSFAGSDRTILASQSLSVVPGFPTKLQQLASELQECRQNLETPVRPMIAKSNGQLSASTSTPVLRRVFRTPLEERRQITADALAQDTMHRLQDCTLTGPRRSPSVQSHRQASAGPHRSMTSPSPPIRQTGSFTSAPLKAGSIGLPIGFFQGVGRGMSLPAQIMTPRR